MDVKVSHPCVLGSGFPAGMTLGHIYIQQALQEQGDKTRIYVSVKSKNRIFLIGPMGAGKSSVGRLLAKLLKFEFYDSDQVIEEQTGANIPWIFDIEGEAGFRKREAKIIELLTQKENIVLATGGGVILNPHNRRCLKTRGMVIYLCVSVEDQLDRTARSRNRPLILNSNRREVFEKLKTEREQYYYELADLIVDTRAGSVQNIVETIIKYIQ